MLGGPRILDGRFVLAGTISIPRRGPSLRADTNGSSAVHRWPSGMVVRGTNRSLDGATTSRPDGALAVVRSVKNSSVPDVTDGDGSEPASIWSTVARYVCGSDGRDRSSSRYLHSRSRPERYATISPGKL